MPDLESLKVHWLALLRLPYFRSHSSGRLDWWPFWSECCADYPVEIQGWLGTKCLAKKELLLTWDPKSVRFRRNTKYRGGLHGHYENPEFVFLFYSLAGNPNGPQEKM